MRSVGLEQQVTKNAVIVGDEIKLQRWEFERLARGHQRFPYPAFIRGKRLPMAEANVLGERVYNPRIINCTDPTTSHGAATDEGNIKSDLLLDEVLKRRQEVWSKI